MPSPEIAPERLEALLAGAASPQTAEERETLALLAVLEAADDAPSAEVGAWLDRLVADAPSARPRRVRRRLRRPSGAREWLAVTAPVAAAAAIAVVSIVGLRGGGPAQAPPPAADRMAAPPERAAQAPAPSAAGASARAVARTGGGTLAIRSGPGTRFRALRVVPDGAPLEVACAVPGERVAGPAGASARWLRLAGGGYVPAALVQAPIRPRPEAC